MVVYLELKVKFFMWFGLCLGVESRELSSGSLCPREICYAWCSAQACVFLLC